MEKEDTNNTPASADIDTEFQAAAPGSRHPRRSLEVDISKFQSALDSSGLSEAEKARYLHVFWSAILEFVDFGFGIHPSTVIATNTATDETEPTSGDTNTDPSAKRQTETTKKSINAADERAAEREEA